MISEIPHSILKKKSVFCSYNYNSCTVFNNERCNSILNNISVIRNSEQHTLMREKSVLLFGR